MSNALSRVVWAMEARGLTPGAKLILILAANDADMDDRCFDPAAIADSANVDDELMKAAVAELTDVGLMVWTAAHPPSGEGSKVMALQIICPEVGS